MSLPHPFCIMQVAQFINTGTGQSIGGFYQLKVEISHYYFSRAAIQCGLALHDSKKAVIKKSIQNITCFTL